jgi:hypothetical protein
MIEFNPIYKIGQKIWHNTPESQQGLIIDISYLVSTKEIKYCVAIGFDNEVWCLERELSDEKIII